MSKTVNLMAWLFWVLWRYSVSSPDHIEHTSGHCIPAWSENWKRRWAFQGLITSSKKLYLNPKGLSVLNSMTKWYVMRLLRHSKLKPLSDLLCRLRGMPLHHLAPLHGDNDYFPFPIKKRNSSNKIYIIVSSTNYWKIK